MLKVRKQKINDIIFEVDFLSINEMIIMVLKIGFMNERVELMKIEI